MFLLQLYLDLSSPYVCEETDGGPQSPLSPGKESNGYMRMRGSDYIRMKAAHDEQKRTSLHIPPNSAYADIPRQRMPSTRFTVPKAENSSNNASNGTKPRPPGIQFPRMQEMSPQTSPREEHEMNDLDVQIRSPSPKLPRFVPKPAAVAPPPKRSSDSSGNSGLQSLSEEADDQPSPMDPFIPKMNHLNNGVGGASNQFRHKKGCKSNDSVVSDASSGFHSDYIPEDNNSVPPNYDAVVASNLAESNV